MKSGEYRRKFSKLVLETDVIFDYVNHSESGANSFPVEQLEMLFDEPGDGDSGFCVERDESWDKINYNMSACDIKEQNAYYTAAMLPLKVLCDALHQEFEDISFRVERNTNNNSRKGCGVLVDRLQLLAASDLGEPITKSRMKDVHATVTSMIEEVNKLIEDINNTVDVKNISSIILCAEHEKEGRENAIIFNTRGAGEFVYAYFNTGNAIRKRLMRLRVGSEICTLKEAKSPRHKIEFSAAPHMIIGSIVPESLSRNSYIIKGKYAANDDQGDTSYVFNHEVLLSRKARNNKPLIETLNTLNNSCTVEAVVYPVQPYVCLTGVRSKKLVLVDVKKLS